MTVDWVTYQVLTNEKVRNKTCRQHERITFVRQKNKDCLFPFFSQVLSITFADQASLPRLSLNKKNFTLPLASWQALVSIPVFEHYSCIYSMIILKYCSKMPEKTKRTTSKQHSYCLIRVATNQPAQNSLTFH